jgi:hypothetical protein
MKPVVALLILVALNASGQSRPETLGSLTTETLLGMWSGRWASEAPAGNGSADLVVARIPGNDVVVGQFTFLVGGRARSLRYEGKIADGTLRFPLVGDGYIELRAAAAGQPSSAGALHGRWKDDRGALPAPLGTIELSRMH